MDMTVLTVGLLFGILILTNILAIWWLLFLLYPYFFFGAPYVPSSEHRVKLMINKAKVTNTDHVVDLGSGDGRIVLAAAQAGAAKAVGYEIHGGLVQKARLHAEATGLADRAVFMKKNFWNAPLSSYSVVFLFQIPFNLKKMSRKLIQELPTNARIVSNGYKIPGLILVDGEQEVFLYKKP